MNEELLRDLPHYLEGEQAVLGSMLIDGDVIPQTLNALTPDDFFFAQNRKIFETIRAMFQAGKAVDGLTVDAEMQKNGTYEAQTRSYLAQIIEITPTSANALVYAQAVRQKSLLRRLTLLSEQLREALSSQNSVTLDQCRPLVSALADAVDDRDDNRVHSLADLTNDFLDRMTAENRGDTSLHFGFAELDKITFPRRGNVVIIGAEPDVGKTAFGLQCAYQMASNGLKIGYFAIDPEMEEVANRLATHIFWLDYTAVNRCALADNSPDAEKVWERIAQTTRLNAERGVSERLMVIDAAGFSVAQIKAMSRIYGLDVVFIDYVQQIQPENRRAGRVEQLDSISQDLKRFARTTKTLVIELAQLHRDAAGREPTMHSLKGSSQFEQDADLILMLSKPDRSIDPDCEKHRVLKIVKNKKGVWENFDLDFNGARQTFAFIADEEE